MIPKSNRFIFALLISLSSSSLFSQVGTNDEWEAILAFERSDNEADVSSVEGLLNGETAEKLQIYLVNRFEPSALRCLDLANTTKFLVSSISAELDRLSKKTQPISSDFTMYDSTKLLLTIAPPSQTMRVAGVAMRLATFLFSKATDRDVAIGRLIFLIDSYENSLDGLNAVHLWEVVLSDLKPERLSETYLLLARLGHSIIDKPSSGLRKYLINEAVIWRLIPKVEVWLKNAAEMSSVHPDAITKMNTILSELRKITRTDAGYRSRVQLATHSVIDEILDWEREVPLLQRGRVEIDALIAKYPTEGENLPYDASKVASMLNHIVLSWFVANSNAAAARIASENDGRTAIGCIDVFAWDMSVVSTKERRP